MNSRVSVSFRCDGSPHIGLGHVTRCLSLADELQTLHGLDVGFVMRDFGLGVEMVRGAGYMVDILPENLTPSGYCDSLVSAVQDRSAGCLVLDIRDSLPESAVNRLKRSGTLVATLDDPSDRRLLADLAFYPPVPQVKLLNWSGFSGQLHVGWEWVVLRRGLQRPIFPPVHQPRRLLVTMGGSDPAGLTLKAIEAIDLLGEDFETHVVLGPGFSHNELLDELLEGARRRFLIHRAVPDLYSLMAGADLALASFGVTAYELAAMGIPAVYLCLSPDHAESAMALVGAGAGVSVGCYKQVPNARIADVVGTLLHDPPRRLAMSRQAMRCIDGQGAARIAAILATQSAEAGERVPSHFSPICERAH